jgi:hypothetical protein
MVQLLGKNQDGLWVSLDLSSDLVISLNKSIEEIEDISQRRGSYSKTFSIPGTSVNDLFFQSAFEVNSTDFNATLKTDCIVQNYGADIFNGTLRLNKITVTPEGNLYEVFILEETSSLSTSLEKFNLCELDYADISHNVNYDNIVSTWNYSGGSYNDYSGIVGKVLYPFAHTGYDPDIGYATWDYSGTGLVNSGTPLRVGQFKPWFNLKYLLDKCFNRAGFTYSSDFFNSDYFKSLFVLGGNSDTSGTLTLGDRPSNQNFFRVSYESSSAPVYFYLPTGEYPDYDYADYQTIVYNTEQFDYLQTYTLSTFPDTVPADDNFFTVPLDGTYKFRVKQTMSLFGSYYAPTYINVVLRDIDSGSIMDSENNVLIATGQETEYTFIFEAVLTQGQRLSIQFNRVDSAGAPYNIIAFYSQGSDFELFESPVLTSTNDEIKVEDNLQCMSGLQLFRNVVNKFNLTAISEGSRNFKIEPYTDFLSTGDTRDWSHKLNLNEPYEIEPLDYSLTKEIIYTDALGQDHLSTRYFENFDEIFGDRVFFKESQILAGSQTVSTEFESMPTDAVGNSGTTMVIPSIYKVSENTTPSQQPTSTGMKLGHYCGLVPFYTGDTDTVMTNFYVQSGVTSVSHTFYPAINHLSQLTNDEDVDISDLNWQPTWDFQKAKTDFRIYTEYNVWRQFYKQYTDLLYSDEARIFTGIFKLIPEDITDIKFNDNVYFLNSVWRLYEIIDGDITEENMVKCKFIKVPYRPSSPTLVPPDYVNQSQTR